MHRLPARSRRRAPSATHGGFESLLDGANFMARALGVGALVGSVLGVIGLVAAPPEQMAQPAPTVAILGVLACLGLALLRGHFDRRSVTTFSAIILFGTVLISIAGYFAEPNGTTFRYFYLWLVPAIFVGLPVRHVLFHVGGIAAASLTVPAIRHGVSTADIGPWLFATSTVIAVGLGIHVLVDRLSSLEARVGRAFSNSPIGMALLTPTGEFLDVNDALATMLATTRSELLSAHIDDVTHADHRAGLHQAVRRVIDNTGTVAEIEKRCLPRDGRTLWSRVVVTRLGDAVFAQAHDVTAERTISDGPGQDALTGLPTRPNALGVLDRVLRDSRPDRVAVVVVDLNAFADLNISYGPASGDAVLAEVARRLRSVEPSPEVVARLAGDEFVAVYPDVDSRRAGDNARLLLSVFKEPIALDDASIAVSARAGVAFACTGDTAADVVRNALTAMHRARGTQRTVVTYADDMRAVTARRWQLSHDLREAIGSGQLFVEYQPIVSLGSDELTGFEALVRWQHPELGRLGPDEFIPLAEETGLIAPLGAYVLDVACADLQRWRAITGCDQLGVCVNVSPTQISDPEVLLASIRSALERSPGAAGGLVIEITETAIATTPDAPNVLHDLRWSGVRLHLDDFGTGYSSLAALKAYPIDSIKIDKSFVQTVDRFQRDVAIIELMLQLASTLDFGVIVEGVETDGQLAVLRELGCSQAQGYVLGRPQPAAAVEASLSRSAADERGARGSDHRVGDQVS